MLHRRDAIVIYPIRFTFYEVPKSRPFHGFLFFQLLTGTTVKSLGTLLHFWGAFQFTQVQPLSSPHKQCWTRVSSTFSSFNFVQGGGRENCKKFSKRMHRSRGNREMAEKYEYRSIVPRTFVQACSQQSAIITAGKKRLKSVWLPRWKVICCKSPKTSGILQKFVWRGHHYHTNVCKISQLCGTISFGSLCK